MKPQERAELTKYQEMEAINARLAGSERMLQIVLRLVIGLGVVAISLLAYHLYDHP